MENLNSILESVLDVDTSFEAPMTVAELSKKFTFRPDIPMMSKEYEKLNKYIKHTDFKLHGKSGFGPANAYRYIYDFVWNSQKADLDDPEAYEEKFKQMMLVSDQARRDMMFGVEKKSIKEYEVTAEMRVRKGGQLTWLGVLTINITF